MPFTTDRENNVYYFEWNDPVTFFKVVDKDEMSTM